MPQPHHQIRKLVCIIVTINPTMDGHLLIMIVIVDVPLLHVINHDRHSLPFTTQFTDGEGGVSDEECWRSGGWQKSWRIGWSDACQQGVKIDYFDFTKKTLTCRLWNARAQTSSHRQPTPTSTQWVTDLCDGWEKKETWSSKMGCRQTHHETLHTLVRTMSDTQCWSFLGEKLTGVTSGPWVTLNVDLFWVKN